MILKEGTRIKLLEEQQTAKSPVVKKEVDPKTKELASKVSDKVINKLTK